MSFSQDIKDEILNKNIKEECCMFAEKLGELVTTLDNKYDREYMKNVLKKKCCVIAFLKGIFLGSRLYSRSRA